MAAGKKLWKILLKILACLVSIALLALAAASLILAKPAPEPSAAPAATPSAASGPALEIRDETELYRLVAAFPAPVMSFMSGSGMTFVSATVSDAAVDGGFGRVATLYWQTPGGEPMTLRSIWPATALNLLEDGFHFMPYSGPSLFGNASLSVRMENNTAISAKTRFMAWIHSKASVTEPPKWRINFITAAPQRWNRGG